MDVVISINGVPIRLTDERWAHIVDSHDYLDGYYDAILNCVEEPELVLPGQGGSLIACRPYGPQRYLMVVYREVAHDDGFIITAFITDRVDRRKALWRRP